MVAISPAQRAGWPCAGAENRTPETSDAAVIVISVLEGFRILITDYESC
jgi:hypothetical protein